MEHSESIQELATALAKAQAAIQPAAKDKTNPAFRSRYADLTSIWEACREPLNTNGLSIIQMPGNDGDGRIALTTMLLHSSGQWIRTTVSTRIVKDDPQGVGSGLTYLRRYALAAMVGVVADEDDDGNRASGHGQAQRATPPPQPAPTEPSLPAAGSTKPQTILEAKQRFMQRYGGWQQHYPNLPEPRTVDAWIDAAREVAARQPPPTRQVPLADEYDQIDAAAPARNGAAGVAR